MEKELGVCKPVQLKNRNISIHLKLTYESLQLSKQKSDLTQLPPYHTTLMT